MEEPTLVAAICGEARREADQPRSGERIFRRYAAHSPFDPIHGLAAVAKIFRRSAAGAIAGL